MRDHRERHGVWDDEYGVAASRTYARLLLAVAVVGLALLALGVIVGVPVLIRALELLKDNAPGPLQDVAPTVLRTICVAL